MALKAFELTISHLISPSSAAQVMYASEQSEAIFPIRMQSLSVVFNSINRDKNPEDTGLEDCMSEGNF